MPIPQLWAILFFFMLFILGLGSQFAGIEAVNTAVIDNWPALRAHKWKVCINLFLLSKISCWVGALVESRCVARQISSARLVQRGHVLYWLHSAHRLKACVCWPSTFWLMNNHKVNYLLRIFISDLYQLGCSLSYVNNMAILRLGVLKN